ncbi:MAG: hypothetical protein NVS1B10_06000 [Candidatus Saccharimonadales bacterium]
MSIVYVDAADRVIGSGTKLNAMKKGIVFRISRVTLQNSKGEFLIQKRSLKAPLPNRWDQTAAGHVDVGETYLEAAHRELKEEMGITAVKLKFMTKYYTVEHDEKLTKKRFNALYLGRYDGNVSIDNDEVADYRWISLSDLRADMVTNPSNFTEGFINAIAAQFQPVNN